MLENIEADKIYSIVQDQLIVSIGGAVAVNQIAIHAAMDLYDITDKIVCFEKVVAVSREVIKQDRERAELERENRKK